MTVDRLGNDAVVMAEVVAMMAVGGLLCCWREKDDGEAITFIFSILFYLLFSFLNSKNTAYIIIITAYFCKTRALLT